LIPINFIHSKNLQNIGFNFESLDKFSFQSSNEKVYDIKEKKFIQIPDGIIEEFRLSYDKIEIIHPGIAIINNNLIINNNNGYLNSELIHHKIQNFPITQQYSRIFINKPNLYTTIKKKSFVLNSDNNYSTFLLGELPKLKHLKNDDELYIHGEEINFIEEYLDIFEIKKYKYIQKEYLIHFENLAYVTPTYFHHMIDVKSIDYLNNQIKVSKKKFNDRIYLSRSKMGEIHDRKIQNELTLEKFLINYNFEIVYPEELSVQDQISIFKNSKIIISPFGATWSNSVFSSKKTKFLMLATKFTPEFARIFSLKKIKLDVLKLAGIKVRDGKNMSKSYEFIVQDKDYKLIEKWIND